MVERNRWMSWISGYNKNLEEVYKNHTYITKKQKKKEGKKGTNEKNKEEKYVMHYV